MFEKMTINEFFAKVKKFEEAGDYIEDTYDEEGTACLAWKNANGCTLAQYYEEEEVYVEL